MLLQINELYVLAFRESTQKAAIAFSALQTPTQMFSKSMVIKWLKLCTLYRILNKVILQEYLLSLLR